MASTGLDHTNKPDFQQNSTSAGSGTPGGASPNRSPSRDTDLMQCQGVQLSRALRSEKGMEMGTTGD